MASMSVVTTSTLPPALSSSAVDASLEAVSLGNVCEILGEVLGELLPREHVSLTLGDPSAAGGEPSSSTGERGECLEFI